MRAALLVPLLSFSLASFAAARPRSEVDLAARLVRVVGAAAADLRAPGPGIARVAAERQARQRAAARLGAVVRALRVGKKKKLGDQVAAGDARLATALATAAERVTWFSDGSVEITLELPLAALEKGLGLEIER